MNKQQDISTKIEETLSVVNHIKEVKVPTSFKQDFFSKIEETKKEKIILTWFTPKLQLAAMLIVVLVNVTAIAYTFSTQEQTSEIDTFAQEYNFETSTTFTIN